MSSIVSVSTHGGADYADVASGRTSYYTFNLVQLQQNESFRERVLTLARHIRNILDEIERNSERTIEAFVIGKTYARKRKNVRCFDPMQYTTWRKEGICNRWHQKYKDYAHALIVVAAVTRELAPGPGQQVYALGLESALQNYFKFELEDERHLYTPGPGKQEQGGAAGAILYIAVAFEAEGLQTIDETLE